MQVKDFARVADSIIGWGSSVGRWARIDNKSVIGEDVHVKVCHPSVICTLTVSLHFGACRNAIHHPMLWSQSRWAAHMTLLQPPADLAQANQLYHCHADGAIVQV